MIENFSPAFLRKLQQLKIHTRRAYLGSQQGSHRSLRRGHGLEFADYRLYSPGDDFRHIDWGLLARSDRLYVREFREEQDLNVIFLIDGSASMGFPESRSKFDLAAGLALGLSYVALSDGDRVTLSVLSKLTTPRYFGQRAFHRACTSLALIVPAGNPPFIKGIRDALTAQKIPGKCFVLSDFLFDIEETQSALDLIRARNFDISIIQILAPEELSLDDEFGTGAIVDSETGEQLDLTADGSAKNEYRRLLNRHIGTIEQYCRSASIRHVQVSSTDSVNDIILTRLPELGILR